MNIYICLDAALLVQRHRFYKEGKNSTCLLTDAELNVNLIAFTRKLLQDSLFTEDVFMLKRALFFFKWFNFFNYPFLQLLQNLILMCQSLAGVQEPFIILRSMSNCFCTTHKHKLDLQTGFYMSTIMFLLPNNTLVRV